jgi:hypothetical protein
VLWEELKTGKYGVIISDLTLAEVNDCAEPKRTLMLQGIAQVPYEEVSRNDETKRLSALYFEHGGLPPKSKEDALHIAIATVFGCDVILSWNFKHIVNLRAIIAVEAVNIQECYQVLRILSPTILLEKGE